MTDLPSKDKSLDWAIAYYAQHSEGHGGTAWMNPATILETLALLRELKEIRPAAESWENYATAQERESTSRETQAEPLVDWKASHELAVEQSNRLARYILTNLSGDWRIRDHACAQCVPEGDIVRPGFVCAYHVAHGIVNGFPLKTPAEGG